MITKLLQYPKLAKLPSIGKSVLGRDLNVIQVIKTVGATLLCLYE